MMQTGAFEIYINDTLEFSKMQTGKMPDMNILQSIFSKHNIAIWWKR